MPLNDADRREIEQLIAQKLDVLSAVQQMPEGIRELLAAEIEQYFYGRQQALRKPENTYTPRWTRSEANINTDENGVARGHAGPTMPRWIDVVGGHAWLDAQDFSMLHVAIGGGADCMFDYLVSSCFATLPAFAEGTTYTSLSGCTFKGYSTIQGAATAAATDFPVAAADEVTNIRVAVIAVCRGTYTEAVTATVSLNIIGSGADSVTWIPAAGAGNSCIEFTAATGLGRSRITGFAFHPSTSQYGIFINAPANGFFFDIYGNRFMETTVATAGISVQCAVGSVVGSYAAIHGNVFAGSGQHVTANRQAHIYDNRFIDGYVTIGGSSCRVTDNHWEDSPTANGAVVIDADPVGCLVARNHFFTGNAGKLTAGLIQTTYTSVAADTDISLSIIDNVVHPSSPGTACEFFNASSITTNSGRAAYVIRGNDVDFTSAATSAVLIRAPSATASNNTHWIVQNNTLMIGPSDPFPTLFDTYPDEMHLTQSGNIVYGGSTGDTLETGKLALIRKGTTAGTGSTVDVASIWWPAFHVYFGSTLVTVAQGTYEYPGATASGTYYVSVNSSGTVTANTSGAFPAGEFPLATVVFETVGNTVTSVVNVVHLLQTTATGAAAAPSDGKFVTYASDANLSDNRVATAGSGIQIANAGTDDGALTWALGILTANWAQSGVFNISHAGHISAGGSAAVTDHYILQFTETLTDPAATKYAVGGLPIITLTANNANAINAFFANTTIQGGAAGDLVHSGIVYGNYSKFTTTKSSATSLVVADMRHLFAELAIGTGTTVTDRYGVYVRDATGVGTLTNQYGIYIANMAKGGTINRAIQSLGGLSTHLGAFRIGSNTAPTNTMDGDITGTRLIVPDAAILHSAVTQLGGPVVIPGDGALLFSDNTNYIGLRAPATSPGTDFIYELPDDTPSAGQVLAVKSVAGSPIITTEWVAAGAGGGHTIRENGTDQTTRTGLNFIDADAGAGLITDDAGNDETEVNLSLYRLESQDHSHASSGLQGGTIAHGVITTTSMKQTLVLTAAGGRAATTSGCASPTNVEAGTNDVDYWVMDFDSTTKEYAVWMIAMPDNYDGSTITARFVWTTTSSTNTHDVRWGLQGRSFGDSETIDQAYGTAQEVTDTATATASQVLISAATSAITLAGTPAGGEFVIFRAYRDPAHADDDMNVDARLMAVLVEYGVSALST